MKNNDTKGSIVPVSSLIMVARVMFGSHAGSGFASGNQADKYFIQAGWIGIFTPFLAIAIMALINREAIAMYNNHNCKDYRDLFRYLYHPFDKLSILFEIYFNLMVLPSVQSSPENVDFVLSTAILQLFHKIISYRTFRCIMSFRKNYKGK